MNEFWGLEILCVRWHLLAVLNIDGKQSPFFVVEFDDMYLDRGSLLSISYKLFISTFTNGIGGLGI